MFKAFLIKYGEIGIKGKNRYLFEDALVRQIEFALKEVEGNFTVTKESGRIYVDTEGEYEDTLEALKRVFGIVGIAPMVQVEDEGFEELAKQLIAYVDAVYPDKKFTFKVNARRGRKNYPMDSMELNRELGSRLLDTSERAKQKVVDLAKQVARYAGPIRLHVVNFTDIQLYIYEKCPHEELTIIMRRYMMKIAQKLAEENGALGLITGESIGQVASQTIYSLYATNEVCTMPVFRPLIGFDKQDIVDIALKIGTYETSIQPYEDCCTIFVAKHPVTKPNLKVIKHSEENLEEKIDELVEEALKTAETIVCG